MKALLWALIALSFHPLSQTIALSSQKITAIICPGFGNAVVDYVNPLGAPDGLKAALERRGLAVQIVPIQRYDWIRVAGGLFDIKFWQNQQLPTGLAYGWYLKRTVDEIEKCNTDKIMLVAHSAGGWLARAAIGEKKNPKVVCLVTLGSPHLPPPDGINCATRGALENTNSLYPGSFVKSISYVSVSSSAITVENSDQKNVDTKNVDEIYQKRGEGSAENVAKINYESLIGKSDGVSGDGVIPVEVAHLDGAKQIFLENPFYK
eukprot:CAMPEP_0178906514 /NCGR_PEP_ID=MMETSP0786-20121207/6871_1 /TAXON_ID=186022 /ORGANISM="Thalassionema frauenfeldii, Strain CCMP 1798" /LENGTH=262 /DNA_ID=CAMNT_0020578237 /DNA_START=18 /DNA_END=806 /DNA_ORIENTATION=-